MPIKLSGVGSRKRNSVTVITGSAIEAYQLLVWRSAIRLEAKGLKHSSGRSVTAHVKRVLGVKGNRDKVLAELERLIDATRTS